MIAAALNARNPLSLYRRKRRGLWICPLSAAALLLHFLSQLFTKDQQRKLFYSPSQDPSRKGGQIAGETRENDIPAIGKVLKTSSFFCPLRHFVQPDVCFSTKMEMEVEALSLFIRCEAFRLYFKCCRKRHRSHSGVCEAGGEPVEAGPSAEVQIGWVVM